MSASRAALLALLALGCSRTDAPAPEPPPSPTVSTEPTLRAEGPGQHRYVDAQRLTEASAVGIAPGHGSPEAAALHFWASMVRGDPRWREVVFDTQRTSATLEQLSGWDVTQARLTRRRIDGDDVLIDAEVIIRHAGDRRTGTRTLRLRNAPGPGRANQKNGVYWTVHALLP